MSKTGYVNRDGARIAAEDWRKNRADELYCNIRAYDNGVVHIGIEWIGKVDSIDDTWADMWKVFRLNVYNYNDAGEMKPDPVEHGKWFPTMAKAVERWEQFLERWTGCHVEDEKFVEVDNDLTPPPPPSLDAPATDVHAIKGMKDDGVGAW